MPETNPQTSDIQADSQDSTLSGQTTTALRDAIIKGELPPGTKLNEPKLAEQFNVSRGPLREAIRRLVSMGLVTHVPHQGASVATLDLESVMELYEVREALEGKAAALAAERMADEDIERLKELLEVHRRHHASNAGEYLQLDGDLDFHYQIIKGSGNKMLEQQLCDELYHLIRMFRVQTSRFKSRSDKALVEHQQLIYAIEQRNPQMAELVMRQHIARAKHSIKEFLTDENIEPAHEH